MEFFTAENAVAASSEDLKYSLEEYFEREQLAQFRNSYYQGKIKPMPYTSDEHGSILSNLVTEFNSQSKKTAFRVYPDGRLLFVPNCNLAYYPDLVIVEGQPQFYLYKEWMKATLNPSILAEILSPSTEDTDRVPKWKCYRTIESLRFYLMVHQKEPLIEVYERSENSARWSFHEVAGLDSELKIGPFIIQMSDIYDKVSFDL